MRAGGGHAKGAEFERHAAKLIVKAFKRFGIRQEECWRSVLSGGHEMSAGDLVMSSRLLRLFPFVPEMKTYRKIDWWHFLVAPARRKKSWKEWQWVAQAVEGAKKRIGFQPLLVLKENRGPVFAMYESVKHGWQVMLFSDFLKMAVRNAEEADSANK